MFSPVQIFWDTIVNKRWKIIGRTENYDKYKDSNYNNLKMVFGLDDDFRLRNLGTGGKNKMITIENFIKKDYPKDSDDLLAISEQIWKLGDLEEIERKISAELFVLHIAINVVGNWQGDGWYGIVRDQAVLIPYITQTLDKLDLQEIKEAFQEVISMFPEFTRFVDDKLYCDIINFITNTRCKVNDERLNQYSEEERSRISKEYHEKMEKLEEISEEQWSYNAPKEGWESILNYLQF